VSGAYLFQDVHVLTLAHDVDQAHIVLEADLGEHLAEIRGGGRVHERFVTFCAHGGDHA
jgi:hypothetical protein